MVGVFAQHQGGARPGRQNVLDQVGPVDRSPDVAGRNLGLDYLPGALDFDEPASSNPNDAIVEAMTVPERSATSRPAPISFA